LKSQILLHVTFLEQVVRESKDDFHFLTNTYTSFVSGFKQTGVKAVNQWSPSYVESYASFRFTDGDVKKTQTTYQVLSWAVFRDKPATYFMKYFQEKMASYKIIANENFHLKTPVWRYFLVN